MFPQDCTDPGDGTAGADPGAEGVDRTVHLGNDLLTGIFQMDSGVVHVGELIRHIDIGIFFRHFSGERDALIDTVTDVSGIMDELHFRSVLMHQKPPLMADGVRHDNNHTVAFYGAHQSKTDALIAGGGLHDNRTFMQFTACFRLIDHIQCDPCLDGAADIHTLKFYQHTGVVRAGHAVELDHRSVAHRFQNIRINHISSFVSSKVPDYYRKYGSIFQLYFEMRFQIKAVPVWRM